MPSWPPGSAPPATQLGRETGNALTFDLDQPTGAGQAAIHDRSLSPNPAKPDRRSLTDSYDPSNARRTGQIVRLNS